VWAGGAEEKSAVTKKCFREAFSYHFNRFFQPNLSTVKNIDTFFYRLFADIVLLYIFAKLILNLIAYEKKILLNLNQILYACPLRIRSVSG
jgi:hypothetical protein